jgi:DNA-binding transcriptional MerR regulator
MANYRVTELATAAGCSVDTVRYYQSMGLLQRPERRGRTVVYDDGHLATLRRIRDLAADGLSLKVIKRVLGVHTGADYGTDTGSVDAALRHAIDDAAGDRVLTRDELAAETGVPDALLASAEATGLLTPVVVDGGDRYTVADAQLVRAGLQLLRSGLPLDALLSIAVDHARAVEETVDRAIDVFNAHVRKSDDVRAADDVIDAFTTLLPAVTAAVTLHFQRTLIARGRARLDEVDVDVDGPGTTLRDAIDAAALPRLDVVWR